MYIYIPYFLFQSLLHSGFFIQFYLYLYFYFAAPAIVPCTWMSSGASPAARWVFLSGHHRHCRSAALMLQVWRQQKKIEKFNNWVNGTNTLFIFFFCCCWFYYFAVILLNKSPCHVSAGKTTPTWRKNQGPGPRKFSLACALLGCPPKNIYHVQIFHVFSSNMTTNIKFHVLSGATEKVTE